MFATLWCCRLVDPSAYAGVGVYGRCCLTALGMIAIFGGWVPTSARAQTADPPPAWMVRGFEAAIADTVPGMPAAAVRLPLVDILAAAIPPGDRAAAVLDRLLPLLGDRNSDAVREAAARALAAVPVPP